jgi:hypothetical protein
VPFGQYITELVINSPSAKIESAGQRPYSRTSMSGREKNTRKAPAYKIIPLNAHSTCEPSQNAQKNLPLTGFLPLRAVPLIDTRLYSRIWLSGTG